jgi:Protein of unknown function (DUF2786)/SprT-like family
MPKSSSHDVPRLSTELERLALRALRAAFDDANGTFFAHKLRRPVFALGDSDSELGRWLSAGRRLELSRSLLTAQGWGVVLEVLKHEMAHQFVDEVLGLREESAHGPAFRGVCSERGIDARASGMPRAARATAGDGRLLERIAKLLALAESPNVHEAQAAMAAAQRLILKYNLDQATHGARASYSFRHLGAPTGRVSEHERILAVILGDHFFVEAIWVPVWRPLQGKRGSVLEVCGSLENLEMAEYVHSFLGHTAERLWRDYKRAHSIRKNAERRTFLSGVMSGFRDKLTKQTRAHREQGLVWVGDSDLGRYFRLRHPRVRWTHYGCGDRSSAWAHGREAGQRIVLHRGVKQGPSGAVRLLGAGRRP